MTNYPPQPPQVLPPQPAGPWPVQPLSYGLPAQAGRPGILTAVGVISIVVGSLSALGSLQSAGQAFAFGMMSRAAGPATATATTGGVVTVTTTGVVSASGVATPAATAPPPLTATPATLPAAPDGTAGTAGGSDPGAAPATPAASATLPSGLTPAEVQTVVQRVQGMAGGAGLNTGQVAALQSALQNTSPPLVSQAFVWSPVQSVDRASDGTVTVWFTGGSHIVLAPDGTVPSQSNTGMPAPGPIFNFSPTVPILLGVDALLSGALAALLLVAGILVFRHSPRAYRLHWVYALCKIPVALLAAVATTLLYKQMFGGFAAGPAAAGGPSTDYIAYVMAGTMLVLACAYPIGLIFVLRSKRVRDYYASVRSA